jgi:hypothetical protein
MQLEKARRQERMGTAIWKENFLFMRVFLWNVQFKIFSFCHHMSGKNDAGRAK